MKQISFKMRMAAVMGALMLCAAFLAVSAKGGLGHEKKLRMIYIPKVIDETNDFWSSLISGARLAAEEYGVELIVKAPAAEEEYEQQNELIAWAIEERPDVLLLSPSHYSETTPMAERVVESGIPLVFIDSYVDKELAATVVSTDNYKAGRKQGELIKSLLPPEGRIIIISHVKGASTAMEREQGLRAALGEEESRVAEVAFCDSMYDKAYEQTAALLRTCDDVVMVAGLNEYSAVGAARAVKYLGLEKKVDVVGFDSSIEEIKLLEEGVFDGIIIQKPFNMGYLGMQAAVRLAEGGPVEKNVDSGSVTVTREDMYTEENQMLLFPLQFKP